MTVSSLRVTVAVLTFRRPGELQAALPLVLEQVLQLNESVDGVVQADLLVIDNDPAGSARSVSTGYPESQVRYVVEPVPGISAGRNRALDESLQRDLLVYLDDDEQPLAGWLATLIQTWRRTNATAVMGRVVSEFERELDPWVEAGSFFTRRRLPTGTEVEIAAAGNLLLDLNQVRRLNLRFHNDFGLSGGEDTLFSRELARAGGCIVWCDESIAIDRVPAERATRRWVLARSWSHGNTLTVLDLHEADGRIERLRVRVGGSWRGAIRILGGVARYLLGLLTGRLRHQARGLRTAYRGAGMLAGAFGVIYQEYARDD